MRWATHPDMIRHPATGELRQQCALSGATEPWTWLSSRTHGPRANPRPVWVNFRKHAAPCAVSSTVDSAAHALISDPDVLLRTMLVESIDICAAWTGKEHPVSGHRRLGGSVPGSP